MPNEYFPDSLSPVRSNDAALDLDDLELSKWPKKSVRRGAPLYLVGMPFEGVYCVLSGSFRSSVSLADGRMQITNFAFRGDLLGSDGIARDQHALDVIALEDARVCMIPYNRSSVLGPGGRAIRARIAQRMAMQMERQHSTVALLGVMNVKARVIAFLVALAARLSSPDRKVMGFDLPMTRSEIGGHLGARRETVCRVFGWLEAQELIRLSGDSRAVTLLDVEALRNLIPTCTSLAD